MVQSDVQFCLECRQASLASVGCSRYPLLPSNFPRPSPSVRGAPITRAALHRVVRLYKVPQALEVAAVGLASIGSVPRRENLEKCIHRSAWLRIWGTCQWAWVQICLYPSFSRIVTHAKRSRLCSGGGAVGWQRWLARPKERYPSPTQYLPRYLMMRRSTSATPGWTLWLSYPCGFGTHAQHASFPTHRKSGGMPTTHSPTRQAHPLVDQPNHREAHQPTHINWRSRRSPVSFPLSLSMRYDGAQTLSRLQRASDRPSKIPTDAFNSCLTEASVGGRSTPSTTHIQRSPGADGPHHRIPSRAELTHAY